MMDKMAVDTTHNLSDYPRSPERKSGWPWAKIAPATLKGSQAWPKISIITPSYNESPLLEETIRSIVLQDYPNLEYFVIDCGSTDGSINIVKKYEQWITYWESEGMGLAHAISKGLQRATGDILAWLNCGDLYAPVALKIVAQRLENVQKGLLVGTTMITKGPDTLDGKIVTSWPGWEKMLYEARAFPQASVFWTRDLWESTQGLCEDFDLAFDYHLWLQMRSLAETFIPEAIVLSYTRIGSSESETGQTEAQRAYAAVAVVRARDEKLLVWLAKLWLYRLKAAVRKGRWRRLTGTTFHRIVTRLVLFPHRNKGTFRGNKT